MSVYVITRSAGYYPDAGAGDWVSVHADEAEAREAFDAIEVQFSSISGQAMEDAYLIHVDPPTWQVIAEKP